jgi:hypothetical protein
MQRGEVGVVAVRSLRFERKMWWVLVLWLVLLLGLHGGRSVSHPAGGKQQHLESAPNGCSATTVFNRSFDTWSAQPQYPSAPHVT